MNAATATTSAQWRVAIRSERERREFPNLEYFARWWRTLRRLEVRRSWWDERGE